MERSRLAQAPSLRCISGWSSSDWSHRSLPWWCALRLAWAELIEKRTIVFPKIKIITYSLCCRHAYRESSSAPLRNQTIRVSLGTRFYSGFQLYIKTWTPVKWVIIVYLHEILAIYIPWLQALSVLLFGIMVKFHFVVLFLILNLLHLQVCLSCRAAWFVNWFGNPRPWRYFVIVVVNFVWLSVPHNNNLKLLRNIFKYNIMKWN